MNQVTEIKKWFELAVPEPTDKSKCVQLGCHFEEVSEMMSALGGLKQTAVTSMMEDTGSQFKSVGAMDDDDPNLQIFKILMLNKANKAELLDSLCDQIVTAIGVAHMFGFDIEGALAEVNRSNFSKFVDGKPVFNAQGKIAKPPSYSPPNLEPFLKKQGV